MALMLTTSEREEVLRFLSAWRNWVLGGAEERHPVFTSTRGLCTSARYGVRHGLFARGLPVWLGTMLIEDFGDEDWPFNPEVQGFGHGHHRFQREISNKACHLNVSRRAWVDEKLRGTGYSERFELPKRGNSREHINPFDRRYDDGN